MVNRMMKVKTRYKMTELGEIPNDWNIASIEDVGSTTSGGTPNRSNKSYYLDGNIPWIKTGELKNKYIESPKEFITEIAIKNSSAKMIEKNSVILAMYGATIGQVSILPFPATTNQACCAIISEEHVYFEFLYYYLKSKKSYLISLGAGGAQPNISQQIIRKIKIILPPLEEQQKIAEILSTVDEQIEQTDQLIEKTKELKKGLMQQLLKKGIGHTEFKHSELGEIPVEWEVKLLEEIADVKGGKRLPKGESLVEENTGFPYIRVSDMERGSVSLENIHYVPENIAPKINNYKIYKGELFISVAGTIGIVGETPIQLDGANLTENANRICNINMNRLYLKYYLTSDIIQSEIKKVKTTNAQPKLALTRIKKFPITVPLLDEQNKISEILLSVNEDIEGYEGEKAKYEELKKGLMQQLLTGKTRVKLD